MSEIKVSENESQENIRRMIDELVYKAEESSSEYSEMDQNTIDKIVYSMAVAGLENRVDLAELACKETGRGIVEDKIIKNIFSTKYIWDSIKNEKTVGMISENNSEGYSEIADPVGVIAGITPVTNPTSTTMFKAIICAKTRNPVIFGFHPSAQICSSEAAKILKEAGIKSGAPKNFIQWIEHPSIGATSALMMHPGVSLVLATGGTAMVKSAYSTGKPALGVGPGNVPCYIEKTADLERACNDIIISKTFDNGMICASEQSVIVDREISENFEKIMKKRNCYFLDEEETERLSKYVISPEKFSLNPKVVGKSAYWIASQVQINVPRDTKILIANLRGVGREYPLSFEKLSPVLAYYIVKDHNQGFEIAKKVLASGGLGHTASIHSRNKQIIDAYGRQMKVGRVIANSPSSQGAIGGIYNNNTPSLTLGCGSYGKNSTTDNISAKNLINRKRIDYRKKDIKLFEKSPKIYF